MTTLTAIHTTRSGLLKFALQLDAAVTAANAILYLAAFALLDGWLGVPVELLLGAGAFLLAFAAFVGRVAAQEHPARASVIGVIAVNVAWAIDSVLLLALDAFSPTLAGQLVIAAQAAGVAALAALQVAGLRRG